MSDFQSIRMAVNEVRRQVDDELDGIMAAIDDAEKEIEADRLQEVADLELAHGTELEEAEESITALKEEITILKEGQT